MKNIHSAINECTSETVSEKANRMAEEYKDTPLAKMHGSQEEFAKSLERTINKQLA